MLLLQDEVNATYVVIDNFGNCEGFGEIGG